MHLNKKAFANSFASLAVIFVVVLYILQSVAPSVFTFVFNAQFYGADVASLAYKGTFTVFLQTLVAMTVLSWISGWLVAHFYNKFAK